MAHRKEAKRPRRRFDDAYKAKLASGHLGHHIALPGCVYETGSSSPDIERDIVVRDGSKGVHYLLIKVGLAHLVPIASLGVIYLN